MAQLLEQRAQENVISAAQQLLPAIVGAMKRMNALIEALLIYQRAGLEDPPAARPTDTEAALAAARANLAELIDSTQATITSGPLPQVMSTEPELMQLFQNLLENAIKYRKPGEAPQIHVFSRTDNGINVIGVKDNGVGFAPEYALQIFEVFMRLHGEDIPGSGLGLATCKRIVERHGGRIWAESTEGVGSTFFFSFPRVDSRPER